MVSIDSGMTTPRPRSSRISLAARRIGEHLLAWRKLQGLTAQQVAERANISRPTLRRLEHGDPNVSMESFLNVARALGQLDRLADSLNPYESDLGRAQADAVLPRRVRR